MIEPVKQVDDLARHIMVCEKHYFRRENQQRYTASKDHIANELIDIFTGVIPLAEHCEIDLVEASEKVRRAEDEFLKRRSV